MRLTQSQRTKTTDPSVVARQSAASGIWRAIHRDPYTLAFGKGFGGSSVFDPHFAPEYTRVVHIFPTEPTYTGMDSFFMTTLLFNGIVLGAAVIGLCVWAGYFALRAVKRQTLTSNSMGAWAAFPLLAIIAQTPICYLGDPMRERLSGLMLGLTWGVALIVGSLPVAAVAAEEDEPEEEVEPVARQRSPGWQASL